MDDYLVILIRKMYFFDYTEDENIKLIYDNSKKLKDFIRKIVSRICPRYLHFFFNDWKNILKKYKYIILMDNAYNSQITKYIKKRNPNIKIIFYYWNIINEKNVKALKDINIDSFWTFDENDSKKYNLKFSPQFYEKCKLEKLDIKNDVCYLGAAKDREKEIINIKDFFYKLGLRTNILISYKGDKLRTYVEYLYMISESKAILDVVGKKQTGITLRCLESVFYEKKLITNNKNIENYEFYNSNNIFIIGKDNIKELKNFLNTEYVKIPCEIINKYSYKRWIENLLSAKEES